MAKYPIEESFIPGSGLQTWKKLLYPPERQSWVLMAWLWISKWFRPFLPK